jgi:4-amino-4-deoxy-L-arabinose transferase-like glycosyltransferase
VSDEGETHDGSVRLPRIPAAKRSFTFRLSLIVAAAAALRVIFVVIARSNRPMDELNDEVWYWHQATLLADGRFFVNPFAELGDGTLIPSAGHPPGYTLVLALPARLGLDAPMAQRIFTALIGVVLVAVIAFLARDIAGNRAGLIAAAIAAVYPHLWNNDAVIGAEGLYGVLVVTGLIAAYRYWRHPRLLTAVAMTACFAAGALTRSEGILLLPLIALPIVLFAPGPGRELRLKAVAALAGTAVVLIAPWVVRNLVTFDRPSFIVTGSGHVVAYGNCDSTYSGRFLGYWSDDCALKDFPDGDESVIDAAARDQGLDYVSNHLTDQPVVVAARVGRLWDVYRPLQGVELNDFYERKGLWPSRLGLAAYYALIPFAIHGLVVMRRRRVPIFPFIAVAVAVTLAAAISFGITRYRSPVDALLPVAAAVSIDALWQRYRARGSSAQDSAPAGTDDEAALAAP